MHFSTSAFATIAVLCSSPQIITADTISCASETVVVDTKLVENKVTSTKTTRTQSECNAAGGQLYTLTVSGCGALNVEGDSYCIGRSCGYGNCCIDFPDYFPDLAKYGVCPYRFQKFSAEGSIGDPIPTSAPNPTSASVTRNASSTVIAIIAFIGAYVY